MSRESPGAFPLFDLLARQWRLPAPATGLYFNANSSAVAAALQDGRVALVAVADPEPPESRIAEDDAGRRTITARRAEPAPALVLAAHGDRPVRIAAGPGESFLIARGRELARVTAQGTEGAMEPSLGGDVLALDHGAASGMTVIVAQNGVEIRDSQGGAVQGGADWGAQAVAISPDGGWIAFGCGDSLWLTRRETPFEIVRRYKCPQRIERINWRADAAFLVAICGKGGLALLDVDGDRFGAIADFPVAPRSAAFSVAANALVTSGAFRIAAWDLARPPFGADRSGALETGRPGLVPVVEVAIHPTRKLVAAVYSSGQFVIAEIGGRDELILQAAGLEPRALLWSGDGRTLGLTAGEGLSLVSLPEALFKS